jgi:hypothetical protein
MIKPNMSVQATWTGPWYRCMRLNKNAEIKTAANLPVLEGHAFHKRLSKNTRITSSEAAPSNINKPKNKTNILGFPANSIKRFLTLVLEADSGSNSERKPVDMTLTTLITIERMSVASRSEDNLPGFRETAEAATR